MEKIRLGQMIEVQRGYDLPKNKTIPGPYPVITSTSISAYHREYKAKDTIVIGRSGTVGNPRIVRGKFWPLNTTLFATNLKGNDIEYMCYFLSNLHLEKLVTGSAVPTLNRNDIYPLEVLIETDVSKQKKIGALLKSIDSKISNNDSICQLLEKVVKLIYDYWFLQFEFPNEEGKPYKSSGGKMVWNEELKREIPEGWKVGNLSNNELTKIIKPGIDKFEGTKNYLETADVTESNYTKGEEVTFENRASRANMQPTKNSVWFAKMKDSVKHLLINEEMQPLIERSIFSTGFLGLQCSSDSFEYIATYIKSEYFEKAKNKLAHGATQQAINNSDLRGIKIVIPCDEVLTEFHKRFKSIYSLISKKTIENKELIDMKDFLLPLLMNGQVTISKN